jgi:hypothetical protein
MFRVAVFASTFVALLAGAAWAEGPTCPLSANDCTATESWVAEQVLAGREADLRDCPATACADGRLLRPRFLRALILSAGDHPALVAHGITIVAALFCEPERGAEGKGEGGAPAACLALPVRSAAARAASVINGPYAAPLDLRDLRFGGALALRRSVIHADMQLGGAYFEQVLNLDESVFDGEVDAYRLRVEGGMTLVRAYIFRDFEADGLRTGGTANFYGAVIYGSLHLRGAHVGNDLDFGALRINGPLPARRLPPRSSVQVPRSAVDISNAAITSQLYATGLSVPFGHVDMSGVAVGGSVWMESGTRLGCALRLERAHIGDDLMLGGGRFSQIDLTAGRIDRELRLEAGRHATIWQRLDARQFARCNRPDHPGGAPAAEPEPLSLESWLVLRNAQIYAIRDKLSGWPDCLTLTGLSYTRPPQDLSGHADAAAGPAFRTCPAGDGRALAADPADVSEPRDIAWWRNWLERDPARTATAYAQLATALDTVGDGDQADGVRFAEREFDHQRSDDGPKRVLDWLTMVFVGFGIGTYALRALVWTIFCVVVAAVFLRRRLHELGQSRPGDTAVAAALADKNFVWCLFASLQTMLPLITLSKAMDDFLHTPLLEHEPDTCPLFGRIALGFAALAVAGLILSGFLLQGLRSSLGL